MTIGILATGDEIIHGDTLNTNSYNIANALSSTGMPLGMQMACSDKEDDIVDCMRFLHQRHRIIIMIGGLGPTSDDRTRFALARFLNVPLIEHASAMEHIEKRLTRAGITHLNDGNRQQALFPAEATLLPNPNGTALGCLYIQNDSLFVLLPGPPVECLPMLQTHVLPAIHQHQPRSHKELLKWRLFGVSEGTISEKLDNALRHMSCETAYRLERPYLEFKVICAKTDIANVKDVIDPIVTPHIIASPKQRASERLQSVIEQLQQPIVIQDQVTGGLLQTLIHRPSNDRWLHFQPHADATWCFHLKGLQAYWEQKEDVNTTSISIACHHNNQTNTETHQLPYNNHWVVNSAAEWFSFCIANYLSAA